MFVPLASRKLNECIDIAISTGSANINFALNQDSRIRFGTSADAAAIYADSLQMMNKKKMIELWQRKIRWIKLT